MTACFLRSAPLALCLACAAPAQGATAILDLRPEAFEPFENGTSSHQHGSGMLGWVFNVDNAITVTQIGWYDQGGDGLSRDFQVGLWHDLSGAYFSPQSFVVELLGGGAGVTVPAGTVAALNGFFRVIDLAVPITLQPGQYQVGGLNSTDEPYPIAYVPDTLSVPLSTTDVTLRSFFYEGQPDTSLPGSFGWVGSGQFYLASGAEMGPMLFVVPETSSAVLAIAGLAFGLTRRRVRHL